MENDEFELANKLFNRLKNYLITNNAVQKIELGNDNILIYSPALLKWYCWPYMSLNKKESLKSFLIGPSNRHGTKLNFCASYFDEYKNSIDPVVKNLCKCIGKPSSLEELAMMMDLMGI
jgi:hypothetical protein